MPSTGATAATCICFKFKLHNFKKQQVIMTMPNDTIPKDQDLNGGSLNF